jgi:hypothetical protein
MQEMEFPDDEPGLLARLLIFLYCGVYPRRISRSADEMPPDEPGISSSQLNLVDSFTSTGDDFELELNLHASMYGMGDKYLVEELKAFSLRKFCRSWSRYCKRTYTDTVSECIHKTDHSALITQILAESVYYKTPQSDRGLKDLLLTFMLRDYWDAGYEHITMAPYKGLLLAVPDLAYDMLTYRLRDVTASCPRCGMQDFSILGRHCTCDDQDQHVGDCEAIDRRNRRCTGCGEQGALVLIKPTSP